MSAPARTRLVPRAASRVIESALARFMEAGRDEPVSGFAIAGSDQEDRHGGTMANVGDRAAVNQVAQEAMSVGRHGDEIAMFLFGNAQDLVRWISQSETTCNLILLVAQAIGRRLEVLAIALHLFRFGELQAFEVTGDPSIGDVHQKELGIGQLRQHADLDEERLIGRAVFKGDENSLVHGGRSISQ